jgi:hypothetical protein
MVLGSSMLICCNVCNSIIQSNSHISFHHSKYPLPYSSHQTSFIPLSSPNMPSFPYSLRCSDSPVLLLCQHPLPSTDNACSDTHTHTGPRRRNPDTLAAPPDSRCGSHLQKSLCADTWLCYEEEKGHSAKDCK